MNETLPPVLSNPEVPSLPELPPDADSGVKKINLRGLVRIAVRRLGANTTADDVFDSIRREHGEEVASRFSRQKLLNYTSALKQELFNPDALKSISSDAAQGSMASDLRRIDELTSKYGANELLALAEELPALIAKYGRSEFSGFVSLFDKK